MNVKKLIGMLFALLLFAGVVSAQTTFYVNNSTGNDANAGTSASAPKLTVASAITAAPSGSIISVDYTGITYSDADVTISKELTFTSTGGTPVFTNDLIITYATTFTGPFQFTDLTVNITLSTATTVTGASNLTIDGDVTRTIGTLDSQLAYTTGTHDFTYNGAVAITSGYELPASTDTEHFGNLTTGASAVLTLNSAKTINGVITTGTTLKLGGYTVSVIGANAHTVGGAVQNGTLAFTMNGAASITGNYALPNITVQSSSTTVRLLTVSTNSTVGNVSASYYGSLTLSAATTVGTVTNSGSGTITATAATTAGDISNSSSGTIVMTAATACGSVTNSSSGYITFSGAGLAVTGSIAQSGVGYISLNGVTGSITVSGTVTNSPALTILTAAKTSIDNYGVIIFPDVAVTITGKVTNSATFTGTMTSSYTSRTHAQIGEIRFNNISTALTLTGGIEVSSSASIAGISGITITLQNSGRVLITSATAATLIPGGISVTSAFPYVNTYTTCTGNGGVTFSGRTTGDIGSTISRVGTVSNTSTCLDASTNGNIDFGATATGAFYGTSVSQGTVASGGDILFGVGALNLSGSITSTRTVSGADIILPTAAAAVADVVTGNIVNSGKSSISIDIAGDTFTLGGKLENTGTGSILFPGGGTSFVLGGALTVSNGTVTIALTSGAASISGVWTVSGGALNITDTVAGTVTVPASAHPDVIWTNGTIDFTGISTVSIGGYNFTIGGATTNPTITGTTTTLTFVESTPNSTQTIYVGGANPVWPGFLTINNAGNIAAPVVKIMPANSATWASFYVLNDVTFNTSLITDGISVAGVGFNVGKNSSTTPIADFTNTTGYTTTTANGGTLVGFVMMSGAGATAQAVTGGTGTFGGFGADNISGLLTAVTFTGTCTFVGEFYLAEGAVSPTNVNFNNSTTYPTIYKTEGAFTGTPTFTSMVNVVYRGSDQATSYELPTATNKLYNLTVETTTGAKSGYGVVTMSTATTVNGTLTIIANQALYTAGYALNLAGASAVVNGYLIDNGTPSVVLAGATGTAITGTGYLPSIIVGNSSLGNTLSGNTGLYSKALGDGVWTTTVDNDFTTADGSVTYASGADTGSGLTVTFSGSGPHFGSLTMGVTAVTTAVETFTLGSNVIMSSAGSFDVGCGIVNIGDYTLTYKGSSFTVRGDDATNAAADINSSTTGKLLLNGTAVTLTANSGPATIDANVTFNGATAASVFTLPAYLSGTTDELIIDGNVVLSGTYTATIDIGNANTLTLGGTTVTVENGGFTATSGGTTGILDLDVATTGGTLTFSVPAATAVENLTISDNVTLAGDVTSSTLTVTNFVHDAGLFTFGTADLSIGSAGTGTFTRNGGTYDGDGWLIYNGGSATFLHSTASAAGAMTINNLELTEDVTLQNARILNVVKELYLNGGSLTNSVGGGTTGYTYMGSTTYVPMVTVVLPDAVVTNALQFNNTNCDFTFEGATGAVSSLIWPATATLARNVEVALGAASSILTIPTRTINGNLTLTKGILTWDSGVTVTLASGSTVTRTASGALDYDANADATTGTFTAPLVNLVYTGAVGTSGIEYSLPTVVNNLTVGTASVSSVTLNTARTIAGTVSMYAGSTLTLAKNTTFSAAQTLTTGTIVITSPYILTLGAASTLYNVTGNVTTAYDVTLNGAHSGGTINASANVTVGSAGSFATTSNISFNGAANATLTVPSAGATVGILTFNKTNNTNTITLAGGNVKTGAVTKFVNGLFVTGDYVFTMYHPIYNAEATYTQGFNRDGVTGTNISHVVGNVAKKTVNASIVGNVGSSVPTMEFPVGTTAIYRPAIITFPLLSSGVPSVPNNCTFVVSHESVSPTGIVGLPITDGVETGKDIARYPSFYWYIKTDAAVQGITFNLELDPTGFTGFGSSAMDCRIIRRNGAKTDTANEWYLQGTNTSYNNEYNLSTNRFGVIINGATDGLRRDGAVFTLGMATNLATDVVPTAATAKIGTVNGVVNHAYDVTYILNLEATGAKMFKNNVGTLRYEVSSSNESLATAVVNNTTKLLTVTPVAVGSPTITVTAYDDTNNDFLSCTFTVNIGVVGTTTETSTVPTEYAISQNYPNPFNPTTTIKYQLPSEQHVIVKVINIIGQEVATLVNEVKSAGYYSINFNATGLASGRYIAVIKAGDFSKIIKMNLVK